MYNRETTIDSQQPTAAQLLRSTFIALITAVVILVTTVLPGEYGIDPTGLGRLMGLTQMGEIKLQLAEEAAADAAAASAQSQATTAQPMVAKIEVASKAQAPVAAAVQPVAQKPQLVEQVIASETVAKAEIPSDRVEIELVPGQGVELKLLMREGDTVNYSWSANGGQLNHDTHGDASGLIKRSHSYGKGRFVEGDSGQLTAVFDGKHGWFWRNRTEQNVTMTLQVSGQYQDIQRVL